MPVIKCKPGNKPCGKRCVPKNYKCKDEKQQFQGTPSPSQRTPEQKKNAQRKIAAAVGVAAIAALGIGGVAAYMIMNNKKKPVSPQQRKDFESEFNARVEKINERLNAQNVEKQPFLEDLPPLETADVNEIPQIEQIQQELVAKVKEIEANAGNVQSDWKNSILENEKANEEWYKLEQQKVLQQHWLPQYAMNPENESSSSVGDYLLEVNEDAVGYKVDAFNPKLNDLLSAQTAPDPKAAQVVKAIFKHSPDSRLKNKPGNGRIITVNDMSRVASELNHPNLITPETEIAMMGNDIIINNSVPPTENRAKALAINLILQQMSGRGSLLAPVDSKFNEETKNVYLSLFNQTGAVGGKEAPYVAAAMAQAEFFYENPDLLEKQLKVDPMDYANLMYASRKARIEERKFDYAKQYGEEL